METIEISALLVDPERLDDVREFQSFVRPVRTSSLSDFCRTLTSIRQSEVDAAPNFPVVLEQLVAWLGDPSSARFASWGEYDKNQLQRDCDWHRVRFPLAGDHFNVKRFWAKTYRQKPAGVAQALEHGPGARRHAPSRARRRTRTSAHLAGAHRGDLSAIV